MKTAVIFAAGLGTRLRPLTDERPKALVEVAGRPLLWHVLKRLSSAGYGRFVINVHHFPDQIKSYLAANGNFGLDISISDESSRLLDTGGGLLHARPLLTGCRRFLVYNVDIFTNLDLAGLEAGAVGLATLLVSKRESKSGRYFLFDDTLALKGWTCESTGDVRSPFPGLNPAGCRKLAFNGVHFLSEGIFDAMEEDGYRDGQAFSIVDFYLGACAKHRIGAYCPEGVRVLDVGKISAIQEAEEFLKSNK